VSPGCRGSNLQFLSTTRWLTGREKRLRAVSALPFSSQSASSSGSVTMMRFVRWEGAKRVLDCLSPGRNHRRGEGCAQASSRLGLAAFGHFEDRRASVGARRFVRRRSTLTDNRGASLRAAFLLGCFQNPPSRRELVAGEDRAGAQGALRARRVGVDPTRCDEPRP
jgi:hypothetical protein